MQISDRSLARFSSVQNGISFVSLSNLDHCLLHNHDELLANIDRRCSITRHTKVQQFIKCIKRLPSYEYVIALLDDIDCMTLKNIISRLQQCRQIKAILIVTSSNMLNAKQRRDIFEIFTNVDLKKTIEIFDEYQPMFAQLQQLIHTANERCEVNDVFITLSRKQKSLRDLRQELGPFLWIHTFRCEFRHIYISK
jgi:hypothetical protein